MWISFFRCEACKNNGGNGNDAGNTLWGTLLAAGVLGWTGESDVQVVIVLADVLHEAALRPSAIGVLEQHAQHRCGGSMPSRVLVELFLDLVVQKNLLGSAGALGLLVEGRDEGPKSAKIELGRRHRDELSRVPGGWLGVVQAKVHIPSGLVGTMFSNRTAASGGEVADREPMHAWMLGAYARDCGPHLLHHVFRCPSLVRPSAVVAGVLWELQTPVQASTLGAADALTRDHARWLRWLAKGGWDPQDLPDAQVGPDDAVERAERLEVARKPHRECAERVSAFHRVLRGTLCTTRKGEHPSGVEGLGLRRVGGEQIFHAASAVARE